MRATHTYALLEVAPATYDEIAALFREAGYAHAFGDAGEIDMHGIALTRRMRGSRRRAAPTNTGGQ